MAQASPDTKEVDPRSRAGNGRPSVGKRAGGRRLSLGTKAVIGVAAATVAAIGIGVLLLSRAARAVTELERTEYAGMATDARGRLDRWIGRDRTRLMEAAFSDQLYELVAKGAAPPDSFIRPAFAANFPTQYGDRFIAVYDLTGKRLFGWTDERSPSLESAAASNPFFRILDNREPAVGLIRRGENVYWVGGAPVLPSNYTDASQPIRGYLVVAQPFNPAAIVPPTGDRLGRLTVEPMDPPKEAFRTRVNSAASRDSIVIQFALPDLFAQQNTLASLTASRGGFRSIEATIRWLGVIGALAAVLLGVAAVFLIQRMLVWPASRLAQALAPVHQGQVPALVGMVSPASEWNSVVQAVNRLVQNGRTLTDRFERLSGVVRDGGFERDFVTGEWCSTPRFRQLLGLAEGSAPNPATALAERLHPDDAARVTGWLLAETPSPRSLSTEVRLKGGSEETWYRLEAEVHSDAGGLPARITGRLADLTAERRLNAAIAASAAERDRVRRGYGRLIEGVSRLLPATGDSESAARQLELLGRGLSDSLGAEPEPFDLHQLLQDAVAGGDLKVGSGIASRVTGDQTLLRTLLAQLLANADRRGPVSLQVEQPHRNQPEILRFAVLDRRSPLSASEVTRAGTTLEGGEPDGADPMLRYRLIHQLVRALGGHAGVVTGEVTQVWAAVPLPAVAPAPSPAAAEPPDFGGGSLPSWEVPESDLTFVAEPRASAAAPTEAPKAEPKVELVADATVTINLDDPPPAAQTPVPPLGDRFRAALARGDAEAGKTARIAVAEIPIRLAELKGGVKAGEARTVIQMAEAISRLAGAVEAAEVAARCRDLIDAAEHQYLESADHLVRQLETGWQRTVEALGKHSAPIEPAGVEAEGPPIDPVTLEQLSAAMADGSGGLGVQLISLFLAEGPTRVGAVEDAARSGDLSVARASAADLKGMCSLVGALALADQCSAVVDAGADGLGPAAHRLRAEWNRVHQALERLMGARVDA